MIEEIQQIVDEVAEDLQRPVVLEDARHSLIAHSAHAHADAVRRQALLLRQTPTEAIAWVTENGLLEADGPLRIRANPRLGAEARVCTPIREAGRLTGFLSVLDPNADLDDAGLERLGDAADILRQLLRELRASQEMPLARERELVDALICSADAAARQAAYATLIDERRLIAGRLLVAVIRVSRAGIPSGALDEHALAQMIRRERHALPSHSVAATARPDHVALVLAVDAMEASAPEPLAERIAHALTALVAGGVLPEPPFVTWSDVVDQPDAVARSYRRALAASRVAEMMQPAGGLRLGWDDLGVYQTLVQVPADELGRSSIDLRIGRLADKPELLQTLETYLELAGDAKRATDELSVHRATLYYRLSKVEQLAEIDLKSGADRFGAYLAIKALRLAGDLT